MKFVVIFIVVLVTFASAQNQLTSELSKASGKILKYQDFKVVCYFTNWSWYRQGMGKYTPEDIDAHLCTHIVYAFASLDASTLKIKTYDSWADIDNHLYERVTAYRKKGIKVTISIGGWNDSTGKYSNLLANPNARRQFIESVIDFIQKYNFQGLDLDLEYPGCWQGVCQSRSAQDRQGFSQLVQELSQAFKPHNYLLSAAVSSNKRVIDVAYDVPILSQYLDWIALMTYDYHGSFDHQTGHIAPLYYYPGDKYDYFNVDYTVNYWIKKGAASQKLIMGVPTYGQSFTLQNIGNHSLNAPINGGGQAGNFTKTAGFLSYYEICNNLKQKWNVVHDPENRIGPYAFHEDQWVSYDDIDMIRIKAKYIQKKRLGGGMMWALDLDDFKGTCEQGKYPLLKALNVGLRNY